MRIVRLIGLFLLLVMLFPSRVHATVDPLSFPNNRVGVHIINPVPEEISHAVRLVNSTGGDWGYVTVVIQEEDRNTQKWQSFFDELRRAHLIPLVRIATRTETAYWTRPEEAQLGQWARFLHELNWPTKNRYVIIYNEPNHGNEWGGRVDPRNYARILKRAVEEFKKYSKDFFVMNAGFDASTPHEPPLFADEEWFLKQMNEEVPGLLTMLDGWVSHSYPNPNFAGSPYDRGRGTVGTFLWELELIKKIGVTATLPVFITETGWQHAEGITYDRSLPSSENVGQFLSYAFANVWNHPQVAAVTPFVLTYPHPPFERFSFRRVLGTQDPPFYPQYDAVASIPKQSGLPAQQFKAEVVDVQVDRTLVLGELYTVSLIVKNVGQSIWGERGSIRMVLSSDPASFTAEALLSPEQPIEPGGAGKFILQVRPGAIGTFTLHLMPFYGDTPFDQEPLAYTVTVKPPVMVKSFATLRFKDAHAGDYELAVSDWQGKVVATLPVVLDRDGQSGLHKIQHMVPDEEYIFTLRKDWYKPKRITAIARSGMTVIDFGELEPDLLRALMHPAQLWKLSPFST